MARNLSKQATAENEAEAFMRQTVCGHCGKEKEAFNYRGNVTYFCPEHSSFQHYFSMVNPYWRRKGEQAQN